MAATSGRAALAGLALWAAPAWAAEPKAVIEGPTTTKVDRTVFLNAASSAFDAQYPLAWKVLGNPAENKADGQADPGGQVIYFDQKGKVNAVLAFTAEREGTFDFALVAKGKPDGTDAADADVLIWRLTVKADGATPPPVPPTPPVPPAPDPTPQPPPSPTNAWTKIVKDAIDKVEQSKEHKVACAKALGPWIRSMAARQDVSDVPAFLAANKAMIQKALDTNYDAWLPFRLAIQAGLEEANRAMIIVTMAQHRAEWIKIADAVEAYQ